MRGVEAQRGAQAEPQYDLASGNRLLAEGALAAGCRFFAGYPITPSSEIFHAMVEELPSHGGLALSAPDEITAIQYCIGASMAGYKAMSATSGPGWSLMIESVQYALMTETPLVVAVVQRLGPATGGATHGAQGDVRLVEFCTSGGYTIPVFAPSTAPECFALTALAVNWAERLRTPVVVLSDKEVGTTIERVDRAALSAPELWSRAQPFTPVGGPTRAVLTGSAHDRSGRLRKPTGEVLEVLRELEEKVVAHAPAMARYRLAPAAGAEALIISYGITARAVREACRRLRDAGRAVASLQIQTLFPVPTEVIQRAASEVARVIVAEENLTGQYADAIEAAWHRPVERLTKLGAPITPDEIIAALGCGPGR